MTCPGNVCKHGDHLISILGAVRLRNLASLRIFSAVDEYWGNEAKIELISGLSPRVGQSRKGANCGL